MKQEWSSRWMSSVQPRKQRKFRANAPLHARRRFVSAHLSPPLRKQSGRRAFPLRKGDEVRIMRGRFRKKTGTVSRIALKSSRIYIDEIKVKKIDGSEVMVPLRASNLMITKINLDDKKRRYAFDAKKKPAAAKEAAGSGKEAKRTKEPKAGGEEKKQHKRRKETDG